MTTRTIPYQGSDEASAILNAVATSDIKIELWVDDPIVTIPTDVTIPSGSVYISFTISWIAEGTTTLHGKIIEIGGVPVTEPEMISLTVNCLLDPTIRPEGLQTIELKPVPL